MTFAPRALGFHPTRWGFGWAVLEGPNKLLAWGMFGVQTTVLLKIRLDKLHEQYQPHLLVVEDLRNSRRSGKAAEWIPLAIERAGHWQISSATVSRRRVKKMFPETDETKYGIALALAEKFPQLKSRLPEKRKPWLPEDKRMAVFDAVGFAWSIQQGFVK